ncbi:MAG: Gfo/Idh/MocA family oxidoreductase [Armatimonadia bacterium]
MAERCVVVGAGGISGAWFPPLKKENVEIAAVVDLRLEAAEKRIAEFELDCPARTDLKKTLKQTRPDFVVDLTLPATHCAVTCTALRAGCHVIGEKPMASSMTEARRMVKTSEETGKLYMVSQSRRYDGRHERLRATIASGEIGRVTTVNCDFYLAAHFGGFRDQMDSPLILDMAIHHFDMARMFVGFDPVAVYAREFNPYGSWYKGDVSASCIFEMTDDIIFSYRGSWCSEGCHTAWGGNWRIIGDKATILYEQDAEPHGQVVVGQEGFNFPLRDAVIADTDVPAPGQHGALKEMLEYLRTGKLPQGECHDNLKSLAMVFGVIESNKKGRRVTF